MNEVETRILNRREELARVTAAVDEFAAQHHLAREVVGDLQVALSEILTNIVDYGYTDDREHEIRVILGMSSNLVEATVEDDGVKFNPLESETPDVSAPLHARRVGGLGIYFVKNLMSEVTYDRIGNRNRLVLRKHLKV